MALSILLLVIGLALLVFGADFLVRGVSALAAAAGVPALVVGLTVVAFGTSTPELVVNLFAAFHHQTDLSFGSIVGSSTINIGFVLAVTALVRPLDVQPTVISREIPMMILGVFAMVVMSLDMHLNQSHADMLSRADGLVLLLLFGVFLYYTVRGMLREPPSDSLIEDVTEASVQRPGSAIAALMTIGGLIGVGVGGRMSVSAAVAIATMLNISQTIIGLTIVSFGTTLPELTTGILAVRRGQSDIAVGNVVGSCIFNTLFIGGVVSAIHPITIPAHGKLDLLVLAAFATCLLPIAMRGPRKITRGEGALLLTAYLGYLAYRTISASRV